MRRSRAHQARIERDSITHDTTLVHEGIVQGAVRRGVVPEGGEQQTPPDELRRRIENLKPGSYIDDIIGAQDSALYRWHEKLDDALRVYIEESSTAAGWDPMYPGLARNAFAEWSVAGFPIRFTFIYDSTTADILIRWKERFPPSEGQRIGVTERIQTSRFWIANARIDVANHDSTGRQLTTRTVAGILRHEIGHALGLNHSGDPTSVMYREAATSDIAQSDRATLKLLYLLPPGSLR